MDTNKNNNTIIIIDNIIKPIEKNNFCKDYLIPLKLLSLYNLQIL